MATNTCHIGSIFHIFRVNTPDMALQSNLGLGHPGGGSHTSGESYTMEVTGGCLLQYRFMFSYTTCVCVTCHTESIFNIFREYTPEMVVRSNFARGYPGGGPYTSGESYTMEVTVRDLLQYRFMFVSVSHVTQSQFPTYSV